jgi:hypothetical protein
MEPIQFSSEQGALRLGIEGEWSVEEFGQFLRRTSDIYHRINALFIIRQALDAESLRNETAPERDRDERGFQWHSAVFGTSVDFPRGPIPFEKIIDLTRLVSGPLAVDAISYASPG